MNYFLAKLKGQSDEVFKVMSQQNNFHTLPLLENVKNYSPDYKLEDDEWFVLKNFLSLGYSNPIIDQSFNSTNHNQVDVNDYKRVLYMCFKQGNYFLFQKMNPSQFIVKKWLQISETPTLVSNRPIIVISNFLDAIYDKDADFLYFKDLARIKMIFKGIENLYREATDDEVNDFVNNYFIKLKDSFSKDKIKIANRKRIAIVLDRIANMTTAEVRQLVNYTKKYCDISCSRGKFEISSENELKLVLYGIEERYYTTQFSKEKRLANSVLNLDSKVG